MYSNGLGAPAVGEGLIGVEGFVTFPEVCAFIGNGATRVFDEESQVPYAYLGDQWISYDDRQSVRRKVRSKWLVTNLPNYMLSVIGIYVSVF